MRVEHMAMPLQMIPSTVSNDESVEALDRVAPLTKFLKIRMQQPIQADRGLSGTWHSSNLWAPDTE
jgi:hypothetical protein